MDLHKITSQANTQTVQRAETAKENLNIFSTPFASMVRLPLIMANDMFSSKTEDNSIIDRLVSSNQDNDYSENKSIDHDKGNQTYVRDDNREDNSRFKENSSNSKDENSQDSDDEAKTSDNGLSNSNHNQDNSHSSGNDDREDRSPAHAQEEKMTSDTNKYSENTNVQSENTVKYNNNGVDTNALEASISSLLLKTHNGTASKNNETILQPLNQSLSEQKGLQSSITNPNIGINNVSSDSEPLKHGSQTHLAMNRNGIQSPVNSSHIQKNTIDQPLIDQQAKGLAEILKADKAVKVTVNVADRTNTALSQTSQSLNINAVAAQEVSSRRDGSVTSQNLDNSKTITSGIQRIDSLGQGQSQAQLQPINQHISANATSDKINGRPLMQGVNSGIQTTATTSDNATTPPNTSGSTNNLSSLSGLKVKQAQLNHTPEKTRPITQQISINISKAVNQGLDRISIQLRPEELGRVEVRLEVSQNGRVSATIIADRPEALDLLRNDSRNLERALQEAGLETHSGDLNFNLRDHDEKPQSSETESEIAEEPDDNEEDGDLEVEIAARILNGDLFSVLNNMRIDIKA